VIIRIRDIETGKTGTMIGQSSTSWHVWWDGQKYETSQFGSIDKMCAEWWEELTAR